MSIDESINDRPEAMKTHSTIEVSLLVVESWVVTVLS